ncbi:MAG: MBL fold metallo-hydrolase [Desulfomonilaceae bacterium]|nr:MBL fold metallo-hydrolase [Desulfomonilaceae bacterium]
MEIVFLGTGAAWSLPEYSCNCATCTKMRALGEERTRTSFLIRCGESILVDCGPDIRQQMWNHGMERPDVILITHEHGDHYLGLDDLLAFRRSLPEDEWTPLPVYASEPAWKAIEIRFGYLVGSLIEKRVSVPGVPLEGTRTRIIPFKTFHGPTAAGSLGYVVEEKTPNGNFKLVYTSDFVRVEDDPEILYEPDVLVIQSHWLNEPEVNRPHHMSFQAAKEYIRKWAPKHSTYLVHISDGDHIPGDSCNHFLKKTKPVSPLADPASGEPYPVPRCLCEWQEVVDRICRDYRVPGPVVVTHDGMRAVFDRNRPAHPRRRTNPKR